MVRRLRPSGSLANDRNEILRSDMREPTTMQKDYDVALSFAGEDRKYAEELAKLLERGSYTVFYDQFEMARLWGKDLYEYFTSVYRDRAQYCVMFISESYAQKTWTNHERRSAQARAIEESNEYILPVRLDDTELPGVLHTVGYLDLRSMPIVEIYQTLEEKLTDSKSQAPSTTSLTAQAVKSVSQEFVLLSIEDKKQYFIPFRDARWDSTSISLELLPETPKEIALLRSMRKSLQDQNVRNRRVIAFALEDDAAWVRPQEVVQTASDSQTVWRLVLVEDSKGQASSPFGEMAYNNISPDQVAEMRARRILLDERQFEETVDPVRGVSDRLLDTFISGSTFSGHENRLQVSGSPIPILYRSIEQSADRFLKFARLLSVLYLKLSYTVEDILQLDLDILDSRQLRVRFEGQRPNQYANRSPSVILVEGICQLNE